MSKYGYWSPFRSPYKERNWPDKQISTPPIWCSVDLRDGNQALINPMSIEKKLKLFKMLVAIGFKEIEVGFPSASQTEYRFLRTLIEEQIIPDDVTIQVLTQAREDLIKKTMQSIIGAKRSIVHLYNSTSVAQRKIVFRKNKLEIVGIALNGVKWIKENRTRDHEEIVLQYSPESFTGTEIDFSIAICEKVQQAWGGREKMIVNLPATVELFGPNVFADSIEYFGKKFKNRSSIILSVHTHNDRGTGVAASELALLAGAERVEGTLFGNGERTGNVDIINLALNMFSHGIDPNLKLDDIKKIVEISNECTDIPVPVRHPYAGELVFTAFSGSHQDAIKKGFEYREKNSQQLWEVPYLAIDPQDIGRNYKAIIRINSQSGKGGVAYVMEREFGFILPKEMQVEFSKIVQEHTDKAGREISSAEIKALFEAIYLNQDDHKIVFKKIKIKYLENDQVEVNLLVVKEGVDLILRGIGNGPIDASKQALEASTAKFELLDYFEHSLSKGSNAKAICYLKLKRGEKTHFGVGIDSNITIASIKALVGGVNFLN